MALAAPSTVGNGTNGENFVSLNYNDFADYDTSRSLDAGAESDTDSGHDAFLELIRSGDTFTLLTSGDGVTYTEQESFTRPDLAGQSMEVGLYYGTYSSSPGTGEFDNFSISGANVIPEPASWAMIGAGMLPFCRRRRKAIGV
jgi:hypothetical protein